MKALFLMTAVIAAMLAGAAFLYWRAAQGLDPAALETKYMTPADRFLHVAGARLRIREEGPEDAPAIVLLHGYLYSLETWNDWARELSKEHRVIRYDLLGHGLTGPDSRKRYAPSERAAFLGEFMDALGVKSAVIAGNSLGGLVAWRFAAAERRRVDALILVAPGAFPIPGMGETPSPPPKAFEFFLRTAPKAGVEKMLKTIFADDSFATSERALLVRDMMRRRGNGDAFVEHVKEFALPDPSGDLAKIAAPTLILWGAEDAILPPAQAPMLEAAIAGSRAIVYEGVGHVPQEEAAGRSLRDVTTFLAERPELAP